MSVTTTVKKALGACRDRWQRGRARLFQKDPWGLLDREAHEELLTNRRESVIDNRVRVAGAVLGVVMLGWGVVEAYLLTPELWLSFMALRLMGLGAVYYVVRAARLRFGARSALNRMAFLIAIPLVLFMVLQAVLAQHIVAGASQVLLVQSYFLLPYIALVGLGTFPITLAEGALLVSWLVGSCLWLRVFSDTPALVQLSSLESILMLVGAGAVVAGVSQLALLMGMVKEGIRDALTHCFTRRGGEELMELAAARLMRDGTPFALIFVDIDNFKSINDQYGHAEGDRVLAQTGELLRQHVRAGDSVIRWGGEEFVLLLPGATQHQALTALHRPGVLNLGLRPDGSPLTASIGIASSSEFRKQRVGWPTVVTLADARMYVAKESGRNRIVTEGCFESIDHDSKS